MTRRALLASLLALLPLTVQAGAGPCPPLLDHRFTSLQGASLDLCAFRDRPILVVNTASKCGYTRQFEKLEALHRQYHRQGLVVLGFPSNDFNQELATDKEIARFCKLTYAVEFPMIAKGTVRGPGANPFYRELARRTKVQPAWNFHKYLILPDGSVHAFPSQVEPDAAAIMDKIRPHLRR